MLQKEKLLVLSNFFFCHYVFKKPSAAEALESVYMRDRVNSTLAMGSSKYKAGQHHFEMSVLKGDRGK